MRGLAPRGRPRRIEADGRVTPRPAPDRASGTTRVAAADGVAPATGRVILAAGRPGRRRPGHPRRPRTRAARRATARTRRLRHQARRHGRPRWRRAGRGRGRRLAVRARGRAERACRPARASDARGRRGAGAARTRSVRSSRDGSCRVSVDAGRRGRGRPAAAGRGGDEDAERAAGARAMAPSSGWPSAAGQTDRGRRPAPGRRVTGDRRRGRGRATGADPGRERWRGDAPARRPLKAAARAPRAVRDVLRDRDRGPLHRGRHRRPRRGRATSAARGVPVHPRRPADDVPQPLLDDAPVRRLRHRRGDQPALPLPPRAGPDRACRSPSTCRPRWATTPMRPRRRARSAGSASRSRASPTWRSCSTACRWARSAPR